ncbi:hypothetical protein IMSHALPRED_010692 [Imshaugia aleurites]|uniref:Uncharacterized protein n=1 Tax=Imshaugia aleurites TaxID=172621 RepID=A0A8H3EST0_9LECA|nr:hypothetical protein IMSHALPRED_010692 [Imshaugia aleurites]
MSGSKLDQIVKGAPPPGTLVPSVVSRSSSPAPSEDNAESGAFTSSPLLAPADPRATLPSSPPQVYLNLLIVEASLRSQYLSLRARRRQNTFFLLLLAIWIAGFSYLLFLRPREDGSGVGGSVYWVVEMGEKVALMGGVVTGMLIWGTGQWDRGVRWPRRWVGITNRGLRSMNAKIVVIKGPWWKELLGHLSFLFPYSSFFPAQGSSSRYIDHVTEKRASDVIKPFLEEEEGAPREEDLSPGGDYIKLLLLPKPFSPDFRENWELYRLEYWEKENERRAHLRQLVHNSEKELARRHGGWFWWVGWRRHQRVQNTGGKDDLEKSHHRHQSEKEGKKHSSVRSDSHSRNTSRSSTLSNIEGEERPTRTRRGSTTASAGERRRKATRSSTSVESTHLQKLTPVSRPA